MHPSGRKVHVLNFYIDPLASHKNRCGRGRGKVNIKNKGGSVLVLQYLLDSACDPTSHAIN
jgi:hypothetical protein